ncbi:GCN5-related N-acetyltransferase [Ketogulonicigenium robustum]|uniref:GCN5-related N-acetyltransferase n=1 Tax=Ketogulonicigenium robustum TaxID=92947 RepID=A0A1W6NY19_9RHOB|nr:GNAT family N-acetyltransferase [Ketogulonicigenium robustum]ARO14124.1 GCN5-related N-acetyltransferase [Ketogulonicigenium robustum]
MRFLPARADDGPRLADLRAAAMRPSLEAVGRFDPDRARRRLLDSFDPDATLLIYIGALAGFLVLRQCDDHLLLDHFYLSASYQGQGWGRAVIEHLQAQGQVIRLTALEGSAASRFYQRCGFRILSSDGIDSQMEWTP